MSRILANDISRCTGENLNQHACPMRETCLRYTAFIDDQKTAGDYLHSVITAPNNGNECSLEIRNY